MRQPRLTAYRPLLSALFVLGLVRASWGQAPPPPPAPPAPPPEETKADKKDKAYQEGLKDTVPFDGLLQLRRKEASLLVDLRRSDLDKPFLLFSAVSQGISAGDVLGGMMTFGDEWILEFRRVDDQVLVVRKNIRFKAEKGTPMEQAVKISFSDSVIGALEVVGESKGGNMLAKLDNLFLADQMNLGTRLQEGLGSGYGLNRSLSSWASVKAFPKNLELEAALTFSGGSGGDLDTVPDSRSVSLTVHYSLVELPGPEFKPRAADERVGYFVVAHKDYSSRDLEGPFQRYIYRWRLEKADPKAKRGAVKEPIVFYLDRTIPYEYRPYVRQGIMEWNKAFEKIGLLDAIEVRQQSDEDTWDPEDVRYNTIRWITSPHTFAVGPSHVNPLTGQIMDADILVDASWIQLWHQEVQELALAEGPVGIKDLARREREHQKRLAARGARGDSLCALPGGFGRQFALGAMSLMGAAAEPEAKDKDKADKDENGIPYWYIGAALKDVIMHEVGHTLGLRHNFKASSIHGMAELHDVERSRRDGLVGSVMDYLPVNLAPEGTKQGEYHPSTLGPWDYWAIEYGYKEPTGDPAAELAAIASRSTTAALAYASDEDVIPVFERNLDPLVGQWDISSDPLAFARARLQLVKGLWGKVLERAVVKGKSYTRARRMVSALLWEVRSGATIAARYVGGQYHHRDFKGDPGERPAFVPVPAAKQREALAFLGEGLFADATYGLGPELLNRLGPAHWWHWGVNPFTPRIDYPLHQVVQQLQAATLLRLMGPYLQERLQDLEKKVGPQEDRLGSEELFGILSRMIFAELDKPVEKFEGSARAPYVSSMRRNLQRTYVSYLSQLTMLLPSDSTASDVRVVARVELSRLKDRLAKAASAGKGRLDALSEGHLVDLVDQIDQTLEARRVSFEY